MKALLAVFFLAAAALGAQSWRLSDPLGNDRGPAPQSKAGKGWILRVEARPHGEERVLFENAKEDSVRLLDFDLAGRTVRWRDLRGGQSVWEVTFDAATGLPATETVFEGNQPSEISLLKFSSRQLVGRTVRNAAGDLLYEDKLFHWPDGTLRRMERDGPDGPLAEAAWSYGLDGALMGAWSVDEDARARGEHREWTYSPGRTEEVLAAEATVLISRISEAVDGGTRETKTEAAASRKEVRMIDAQGRTTEEVVSVKGVVLQTRRWKFDTKGRILETSVESAGPQEVWTYVYQDDGLVEGTLKRDGIIVREEIVRDGEKESVRLYDHGDLFLVETWQAGRRVKETYYSLGQIIRERTP